MGAYQNNGDVTKLKRGNRGSVRNDHRLSVFTSRKGTGNADWGGCNPDKLQGVVYKITALGGAVTIGLSRDQGAHMMTLLLDESKTTLWFNGDADLDEELDAVAAKLDALD